MTEILVGFLVAAGVGLTGVGAGSLLAPVLMLFFKVPPAEAVGTALAFSAVIKLTIAPVYIVRKQIHYPTLLRLCCGGVPGVLLGFFALSMLDIKHHRNSLFLVIGALVATMAFYNLVRTLRRSAHSRSMTDRSGWLPFIAFGIGSEVGFSSAGAGALGGVALLNLTPLSPAQVVGTDVMFGLACSLIGGGFHLSAGHFQSGILIHLILGGVFGALIGANLLSVLPSRPLRVALSAWLTCMGVQLCWQALG
ncbi:MAG TPA: sulfite exporter TauE/SafE family protein [Bryobacteraceae bacterium]|nr:sulfite exporter TauE/SafE family protein [Bryobacteraceae bacterium]